MARNLTAVERDEKAREAVELSAKGWADTAVAGRLGINRATVKRLRENEYARRSEHRGDEREKAIAVYEAVIREGWERLSRVKDNSNNVTGVLNAIRAAQERIDKLTGAEAPIKTKDVTEDYVIEWDGELHADDVAPG